MKHRVETLKIILGFIVIFLLGAVFRFSYRNWDDNHHLHPDERFLTMVAGAMKLPTTLGVYLDPAKSLVNPANLNFNSYVYGTWPVILTKAVAVWLKQDNYDGLVLTGRSLSAGADLLTLIIIVGTVFWLTIKLKTKLPANLAIWTGLIYALAVLPIQLSHFFTTDPWLTLCLTASICASLIGTINHRWYWTVISGLFLGLAAGAKVSAIYAIPILGLFLLWPILFVKRNADKKQLIRSQIIGLVGKSMLLILATYFALRLSAPYYFAQASIFNPSLNRQFVSSMKSYQQYEKPDVWFPPSVQWISKPPVIYSLENFLWWGIGIPAFILLIIGLSLILKTGPDRLRWLAIWASLFFLFQSVQFVKALRYSYFLYPWFALFAAYGLLAVINFLARKKIRVWPIKLGLIGSLFIWPLMFFSIYIQPHSRISASSWMYQTIPSGSTIAIETWDDGLPLTINQQLPNQYTFLDLPVFDLDTPAKWAVMKTRLDQADYYVLSSNRGWGSIPTVPQKYPLMTRFYQELMAGQTQFKKVAEFSSYPSLKYLGVPLTINDSRADETFTVYDHPQVIIFKNSDH